MVDAQIERVTYAKSRYADQAEIAGRSSAARLYEVVGPKRAVTGEKANASPGTDVVQERLTPVGAKIACV